jgi:ATP-binding cassette subfamily B protein
MKPEMSLPQGIKQLFQMIMTQKSLFFTSLILMCLTTICKLLDPLVVAHIVDHAVPNEDMASMLFWGITFSVIIILSGLLNYFQIISMGKLGLKIITVLKNRVFSHLLFLPVAWFDKTPVGVLISRVESDCERVKELFSSFSVTIIGNILFFVGMVLILMYRDWRITITLFIPLTFVMIISILIIRYLTKYYKRARELNADITGRLTEYIQGVGIIQLFNQQKRALAYINEKSKEKQKIETKAEFIEYVTWGLNDFLIQTVFIVILVLSLSPKILDGQLSIGSLIIFIQYSVKLVWPIIQISENLNQFQRAFVSLRRVFGLLTEEKELQRLDFSPSSGDSDESESETITSIDANVPDSTQGVETFSFEDSIEFRDVWFKYAPRVYKNESDDARAHHDGLGGEAEAQEWVLRGVSFCIKKGSKVALVGASGSGKTTCVSLLCRFYNIQKGKIFVDGKDLYHIELAKWRMNIGLILQDIILFPGNLLENIRIYDDDITQEKVMDAIHVAHADKLLDRMDGNLLDEIKERGQNLSMGERQLISFARAMCFDPEIIIMDEATASIDAKTENMIHKSINQVLHGKTALIVAHKLASVVDCDEILLFDNGEIIARGTHDSLLQSSAEYKKLVELQFFGKEE